MLLLFLCQKNSLICVITLINKSQQTIDNRQQTTIRIGPLTVVR